VNNSLDAHSGNTLHPPAAGTRITRPPGRFGRTGICTN